MRICFIHRKYLPVFSGAAIRSHEQARLLKKWGNEVLVITPRYDDLRREEEIDGVKVVRTWVWGKHPLIQNLSFSLSSAREILRRKKECEIIQVFSMEVFTFIPLLVAKLFGKKTIYQITLMKPDPGSLTWGKLAFMMKWGLKLVDGFLLLSTPMVRALKGEGLMGKPHKVIPNGTDLEKYSPPTEDEREKIRKELGILPDVFCICFVGDLIRRKGADMIVEIFRKFAETEPRAFLLLMGRNNIEAEHMEALGILRERVIFTGFTSKVDEYLKACDVLLFPSRREGFPSSVIQAMATGVIPVVSEMMGVAYDIVTDGHDGYIIKGENPEDFLKALREILYNDKKRKEMRIMARKKVEERFSITEITKEIMNFYKELLSEKGKD